MATESFILPQSEIKRMIHFEGLILNISKIPTNNLERRIFREISTKKWANYMRKITKGAQIEST